MIDGEEYMRGIITMMANMKNEDGDLVFPHLDADCLRAMAGVWDADPVYYGSLPRLEACTRAYWVAVKSKHPRIH